PAHWNTGGCERGTSVFKQKWYSSIFHSLKFFFDLQVMDDLPLFLVKGSAELGRDFGLGFGQVCRFGNIIFQIIQLPIFIVSFPDNFPVSPVECCEVAILKEQSGMGRMR